MYESNRRVASSFKLSTSNMRRVLSILTSVTLISSASAVSPRRRHLESASFPFDITYSDDGRRLELTPFLLDVFETDGDIPMETLSLVEDITNQFLKTELDKIYKYKFSMDAINMTVLSQSRTVLEEARRTLSKRERIEHELDQGSLETTDEESTYLRKRMTLDVKAGTELKVSLNVTFDRQPSPDADEVGETIKTIMKDLSIVLSNFTASGDTVLAKIYMIRRRELPTPMPTLPPTDYPSASPSEIGSLKPEGNSGTDSEGTVSRNNGTDFASGFNPQPIDRTSNSDGDSKIGVISGSVVAAAALVLLASYFMIRKRREDEETASKDNFLDGNSDVESSMQSPNNSPTREGSNRCNASPSTGGSNGKSAADSIFSGLSEAETESPRHQVIQTKKSMSSQTTVQASGNGPTTIHSANNTPTSLHMVGSLFAFEEGSFEDDQSTTDSSDDLNTDKGGGSTLEGTPTNATKVPFTPATDRAIVNGQTPATPPSQFLRPKTPVTDAAVDMSILGMAHHDAAMRELVFDDASQQTPLKRNLSGLPPMSPASRSRTQTPTGSPTTNRPLMGDLESHNMNKNLQNKSLPSNLSSDVALTSDETVVVAGATLVAITAVGRSESFATSTVRMGTTNAVEDMSSSGSSPMRANFKKNKYTGLASTGKTSKISPSPMKKKFRMMMAMSPKGWKNTSIVETDSPSVCTETDYEVEPEGAFPRFPNESPIARHRRHAGYEGKGDGAADYQNGAMHPLDWSNKGDNSVGDSTLSSHREAKQARRFFFGSRQDVSSPPSERKVATFTSPAQDTLSPASNMSTLSGRSNVSNTSSKISASRQLIQDLVWLERKISGAKTTASGPSLAPTSPSVIEAMDSLSYVSGDEMISPSSNEGSTRETGSPIMQSIVCRDCFAPPGKLQIVIHSTKDGPALHTVNPSSSLAGHLFPGDLIIAVDNVDTRTYTAEAVMKMMAAKSDFERKITVLHFDESKRK